MRTFLLLLCLLVGLLVQAQPERARALESAVLRYLGPSPDTARLHLDSLNKVQGDPEHAVRQGYLEAALLSRTGQLREAWQRIRAVDELPCTDPALRAQVKNFLGRIAYDNDEFGIAIAAYHDALELQVGTDSIRTAVTYNNLARVYERLKDYDKAFEALDKSVAIYASLGDHPRLAGSLLNLGVIHYDRKRYAEAEDNYLQSLTYARGAGMTDVECIALESLGNVQRETGRYGEALANYTASMAIAERSGSLEGMASISRNIGELYLDQGDAEHALPYLQRTLTLADSMGSRNYAQDGHQYLAKAYTALKRYPEALASWEAYMAVKDSILSDEKNKAIAGWQERLGTAEKERTILEQQVRAERDAETLRQRDRQLWVLGIGIAAALLVLLLLLRDRSRARKLAEARITALEQEQRIIAMRGMLQGAEQERERVAGELHDGVGILLSAARMRVGTDAPGSREKAGELLEQAAGEVRRISHALMPGSLLKLGLPQALRELADGINGAGHVRVDVHVHGFRQRLDPDQESGLYRMAQEAVNNALKHASAERITVELSMEEDARVSLVIADDGKGFNTGAGTDGHGLDNIRARAALLGGSASVRSSNSNGTTWEIELPVPAKMATL